MEWIKGLPSRPGFYWYCTDNHENLDIAFKHNKIVANNCKEFTPRHTLSVVQVRPQCPNSSDSRLVVDDWDWTDGYGEHATGFLDEYGKLSCWWMGPLEEPQLPLLGSVLQGN